MIDTLQRSGDNKFLKVSVMKNLLSFAVGLLGCFSNFQAIWGQTQFKLGFALASGPHFDQVIYGKAGSKVHFDLLSTLTQSNYLAGKGASGYSISFKVENADLIDGTAASGGSCGTGEVVLPFPELFCSAMVVDPNKIPDSGPLANQGPQGEGYVDFVAFIAGRTLQGNGTSVIGKVRAEVTIPEDDDGVEARFYYADGLQGNAQPVDNSILAGSLYVQPALVTEELKVLIKPRPPFVTFWVETDHDGGPASHQNLAEIPTPLGEKGRGTISLAIETESAHDEGISAWRFSLSYAPTIQITHIQLADELLAAVPGLAPEEIFLEAASSEAAAEGSSHLRVDPRALFISADPERDDNCDLADGQPQGHGLIAMGDLAFSQDPAKRGFLPGTGRIRLLQVDFETKDVFQSLDDPPISANFIWAACHFAGDKKITNGVTIRGKEILAGEVLDVPSTIFFFPVDDRIPFIRGDANGDRHVNIADVVFIVNRLYRNGPSILCPDAADANHDGHISLADPVYLINHLFFGGPPLEAPFPGCGVVEDSTRNSCPSQQMSCQ